MTSAPACSSAGRPTAHSRSRSPDRNFGLSLRGDRLGRGGGVDDGPVAEQRAGHKAPFVDGNALDAGIRLDRRAQGTGKGLELGLDDVVGSRRR